MDEALDLGSYLPRSFSNASEQAYLDFLWSAFQTNYEAERFEFASLAFHLLYMSFVSFSICGSGWPGPSSSQWLWLVFVRTKRAV